MRLIAGIRNKVQIPRVQLTMIEADLRSLRRKNDIRLKIACDKSSQLILIFQKVTGSALLAEQAPGNFLDPLAVAIRIHKSGRGRRQAARGNDNASTPGVLLDLLV